MEAPEPSAAAEQASPEDSTSSAEAESPESSASLAEPVLAAEAALLGEAAGSAEPASQTEEASVAEPTGPAGPAEQEEPAEPAGKSTGPAQTPAANAVFDVLEECKNIHENILTCGATPLNENPVTEQYLDVIRMEVLRHVCTYYMGLRMTDDARLVYEMDVLTRSYHPYFGHRLIEPYEPLTRFLKVWKKWMRKRLKSTRPSLMGKSGMRAKCGMASERKDDTEAYLEFEKYLKSVDEGKKFWPDWYRRIAKMRARIAKDFRALYLADFAAVDKLLKKELGIEEEEEEEVKEENQAVGSAVGAPEEASAAESPQELFTIDSPQEEFAAENPQKVGAETEDQEEADETEVPEELHTIDPKDLLLTEFQEGLYDTEGPEIEPNTYASAFVEPPTYNNENAVNLPAKSSHATDDTHDDLDGDTTEENLHYSHFDEYMDLWNAGQDV